MNTEEMRALVREMPASEGIDFPTERILMHSEAVAPSLAAFSASQHFVDDAEKVESELQKLHVAHMWLHAHLEALEPGSLEYEALAIIHMPLEAYQVMLAEHLRDLIEPPQSFLDVLLGGLSPDVVESFKQAIGLLEEDLPDETPPIPGRVHAGEPLEETRVDQLEVGDTVQIGGARILIESIDPYDRDLVINKDAGLGVFGPRTTLLKVVEL